MPRFEDHECLLPTKQEDVVTQFIESGFFIVFRRTLRSLCMISRRHPDTSKYFKSYSACRNEEVRQLMHHYNMIHPFSIFNLYWEFYMFLVFTVHYVIIPIEASIWIITADDTIYMIQLLFDIMHLTDVVKIFFTGYYNRKTSRVILEPTRVAKRYLITFFFFDVVSCSHSFIYPIRLFVDIPLKVTLPIRTLSMLKIVRVARWMGILELFRRYWGFSSHLLKAIKVILIFLLINFWALSINFFMHNYVARYIHHMQSKADWKLEILETFLEATTTFLLVSVGDAKEFIEYCNAFLFICFGFTLQLFVYAQVIQVWTKYANADNKRQSLHQQFDEYMKYKELPLSLRGRFTSYFQFKFHKHFFKESDIANMISPFIRQEIQMHVTRNHIEKVDFFRYLPENVLMKVVAQLKSEIYLPGDVIISAGTTGTSMFFIYHGTVAIFTPRGREICHLDDGAHFGEIALILSEKRVANVIAVTTTELFTLRRTDFLAAIEPYPECMEQLMALATERLQNAISKTNIS